MLAGTVVSAGTCGPLAFAAVVMSLLWDLMEQTHRACSCLVQEPALPPRSPGSFSWRMVLDTQVCVLGELMAGGVTVARPCRWAELAESRVCASLCALTANAVQCSRCNDRELILRAPAGL